MKGKGAGMAEVDRKIADRKAELWDEYRWKIVGEEFPDEGAVVLVAKYTSSWWAYLVAGYVDGEFRDMEKVGDDSILKPHHWKPIFTPVEAMA